MTEVDRTTDYEQLGVSDVLKRYRLAVPPYQRDYAWDEDQVTRLIEDVAGSVGREPQHFIGCIVTIKRGAGQLEVVDGQQRLATTALILAAMRIVVGNSNVNLVKLIESFLFSISGRDLEEHPNLKLNTADDAVFHSFVTKGVPGPGFSESRTSHVLLKQAFDTAHSQLRKIMAAPMPDSEKWLPFQDWIEYLQYKTNVILLIVASDVNAFRMFETLNARGLQVSQSDLIKNYLFGQSGSKISQAQNLWTGMRTALEAIDADNTLITYIRHVSIVTGGFIQQKNLYSAIQGATRGERPSIALLSTWESLAPQYAALSNSDSPLWDGFDASLKRNIKVLNLFDIEPLKPLLLASAKKMDKKEVVKTFQRAVSIGVRLIIASRTTSQSVEAPLSDVSREIWEGKITTSAQVIDYLMPSIPTNRQFQDAFQVATVSKSQFARYYLRCLEMALKQEPEPWLIPNDDAAQITLEHVLPQKPEQNWPNFTDEDVKTYVKRIGNMVLLKAKTNSNMKSLDFQSKKKQFNSPYETTIMVGKEQDWSPSTIVKRQKKLAELALIAWPIK